MTLTVVRTLSIQNHKVLIEHNAESGSGFTDTDYKEAEARIVAASEIFKYAEMIVKVKEPQMSERSNLHKDQLIFTFLHLASDKAQTSDLLESRVTAITYETVTDDSGSLPLLTPMSEVAGRLGPQMGAWALQKANEGSGTLFAGLRGVLPANVLIICGGVVDTQASLIASAIGTNVNVLDKSIHRLTFLNQMVPARFNTLYLSEVIIADAIFESDLVIGTVLMP